jgi:glycosyltransferase involved in cell wall biosynthesis
VDAGETESNLRPIQIARALHSAGYSITLALPNPEVLPETGFRVTTSEPQTMPGLLKRHRIVISTGTEYPPRTIARRSSIQVFDLADATVADLAESKTLPTKTLMEKGDLVLCGSQHQRDLLMGMAVAYGLQRTSRAGDADLIERFAVVPYGHSGAIKPDSGACKALGIENIRPEDPLLAWISGFPSFLDPVCAVRAMRGVREVIPNARLVFLPPPGSDSGGADRRRQAMDAAEAEGLLGEHVFFPDPPLHPKMHRDALAAASGFVCAGAFAADYRAWAAPPFLDAIRAEKPLVCTRGCVLASVVDELRLGYAVAPDDPADLAARMVRILDPGSRKTMRANLHEAAPHFGWESTIAPLRNFLDAFAERLGTGKNKAGALPGQFVKRAVGKLFE